MAIVIDRQASKINDKLDKKAEKVLKAFEKQERKFYSKLINTKDSVIARTRMAQLNNQYSSLKNTLTGKTKKIQQYLPALDSIQGVLSFLDSKDPTGPLKNVLEKTKALQQNFDKSEKVKEFIKQRKRQLTDLVGNSMPAKALKNLNKKVYYYSQQVKEYKAILNDPDMAMKKALALLKETKLFQDFFSKNSMLASLFPMPSNSGSINSTSGFAGLQTRTQLSQYMLQANFSNTNNSLQNLQQKIQGAEAELTSLRNRIDQLGGNSEELEMPNFKPNSQRSKSFFKRLELGTNFQTKSANNLFPTTTDLGLSIGYKFNDKSVIGIGSSYKLGWGHGWNNINLSSQGFGVRSFVDMKIKKSWWISGGYEQNYQAEFNRITLLKDFNSWQKSGLLGMSKTVSLNSKILKSTKVQFLWDFLSGSQRPRTQPIVIRVGYSFN